MSDANALLISQAGVLRRLWGVEKLSLCLPPTDDAEAVLAHGQNDPAVPELAEASEVRRALSALRASSASPVIRFDSRQTGCHLFSVTRLLGGERTSPPVRDFYSAAFTAVTFWIGIDPGTGVEPPDLERLSTGEGPTPRVLDFAAELVWFCRRADAVMRDPVTTLPGRADFQSTLIRAIRRSRRGGRPLALMLVNPDDLIHVNRRFGRPSGDQVIREIAERLEDATGRANRVHRYGGAVFALTLEDAPPSVVAIVAGKLLEQLVSAPYLDGELRLGFCIGIAQLEDSLVGGSGEIAQELVQRADAALGDAKRSGSHPIVVWGADSELEPGRHHDRLVGIFTADQSKDYRNMLLLWDMVRLVAESPDLGSLAIRAVDHLAATFEPQRVALVALLDDEPALLAGVARRRPGHGSSGAFTLKGAELVLIERVRRCGEMEEKVHGEGGRTLVIPLSADGTSSDGSRAPGQGSVLGALLLTLGGEGPDLDASDRVFLDALGGQLAAALDRIHLAERDRHRQDEERRRLENEVKELREARQRVELVHRSPEMGEILDVVRRVAPTDVTVLVSGESGTGKEVVARLVHEMSPRRERQPIVVDCGAIAASLIDSELFGHEKGAYTGAERRSFGRLAEADGGTLILDEIGELPLEVQSKLLRFVQEKQITPVGANRSRTVDARLIAVTHRNLAAEVAAGRFRGDLYHRLNVVHLKVPPLGRRPEDVVALTEHFLRRFVGRYRKPIQGLTTQAEARVRSYPWPGNVRELENRLLRAVILCESSHIGVEELGLADHQSGGLTSETVKMAAQTKGPPEASAPAAWPGAGVWPQSESAPQSATPTPPSRHAPFHASPTPEVPTDPRFFAEAPTPALPSPPPVTPPIAAPVSEPASHAREAAPAVPSLGEGAAAFAMPSSPGGGPGAYAGGVEISQAWSALREELGYQLSTAGEVRPPLGTWLADDLMLAADAAAEGVASRGATLLGMPETTYRRRLQQAQSTFSPRWPQWQRVVPHLSGLLSHGYGGVDLLGKLRHELLQLVVEKHGDHPSGAAALMGVSPPTYRRWRKELEEGS